MNQGTQEGTKYTKADSVGSTFGDISQIHKEKF